MGWNCCWRKWWMFLAFSMRCKSQSCHLYSEKTYFVVRLLSWRPSVSELFCFLRKEGEMEEIESGEVDGDTFHKCLLSYLTHGWQGLAKICFPQPFISTCFLTGVCLLIRLFSSRCCIWEKWLLHLLSHGQSWFLKLKELRQTAGGSTADCVKKTVFSLAVTACISFPHFQLKWRADWKVLISNNVIISTKLSKIFSCVKTLLMHFCEN